MNNNKWYFFRSCNLEDLSLIHIVMVMCKYYGFDSSKVTLDDKSIFIRLIRILFVEIMIK